MKRSWGRAALAIVGILGTSGAFAADLYVPPVAEVFAPEVSPWSTCYVGVPVSYTTGSSPATAPFSDNSAPLNGYPFGLQAGCDIVPDGSPLLLGVVTDIFINGPSGKSPVYASATPGIYVVSNTSIPVFGSLRARAGVTVDDTLFYLSGGLAIASVSNNVSTNNLLDGETLSNVHLGWVAGGGIEHRVTENISLFAEYAYYDLGAKSYNYQGQINFGAPVELHPAFHQVKVGLNYRF